MKVFISSVIVGMEEFRDAAARAVRSLGHEAKRAEDFGARPDSPQVTCLAGVREVEAVIVLIGGRYGAIQSSSLSATHEEYREARERCPVIAMVQIGVEREPKQAEFLQEVQDWERGGYTQNFRTADQLQDAVVRALHQLELSHAAGPVDADEMLRRAIALLPEGRSHYSDCRVAIALVGGPSQAVLRPAQLERTELKDRLQQLALFGDSAVLKVEEGTETHIVGDALVFKQEKRSLSINEQGSIVLDTAVPPPERGLPVVIEEEVEEILLRFLRFASAVLDHIDHVSRLSHYVVAVTMLGADHLAWRTRTQHARSPNSVSMSGFGREPEPVGLSPPHRTRATLRLNAAEIAEDLKVRLRRKFGDTRDRSW